MGSRLDLFLPQCKARSLKAAIIAATILILYIAIANINFAFTAGFDILAAVSGIIFLTLAWALYRLRKWARITVVVMFLLTAVVLPVGLINPFMAMDMQAMRGKEAPEWYMLALLIFPIIAILLYIVHILGKYKKEFR